MYNPKIWYDGDIVTSGGLNNIEQGIAQNAHDIEDMGDDIETAKPYLMTLQISKPMTLIHISGFPNSQMSKYLLVQCGASRSMERHICVLSLRILVTSVDASVILCGAVEQMTVRMCL